MNESSCPMLEDRLAPLVIDWKPYQRSELETDMRSGLAVVAYDCHSIRLLPACRIEGSYGYVGVTHKEEMVQLVNASELRANLPKYGAKLGIDLEAELRNGASLDVATIQVGKWRTTRYQASPGDLEGDCTGATHFVRGAHVGAFAMDGGSSAKVRSAAEIFGGGANASSTSSAVRRSVEGDRASCSTATRKDTEPPDQCGGLLRLELVAVEAKAASASAKDAVSCPRGLVWTGAKCAEPAITAAHACTEGDAKDCTEQCRRGSAESCDALGDMHTVGWNVAQDVKRANELYDQACTAGYVPACRSLSVNYLYGQGVPENPERAAQLDQRGCDGGDADSCWSLGAAYQYGRGARRDLARAVELYRDSCAAGSGSGCAALGWLYDHGEGVTQDFALAGRLYRQGCDGRDTLACFGLGTLYERGLSVAKDLGRAAELYAGACKDHFPDACDAASRLKTAPR